MKNMIRLTVVLGCLLVATANYAQDKPTHKQTTVRQAPATAPSENTYTMSAEQMTRELGLNADQAEKLKSIEEETNTNLRELEKLDPKERDPQQAKVRERQNKMVASVLTPEQNKKLAAIVAKIEQEHKGEKMRTNNPAK
jgi:hypothetical protein